MESTVIRIGSETKNKLDEYNQHKFKGKASANQLVDELLQINDKSSKKERDDIYYLNEKIDVIIMILNIFIHKTENKLFGGNVSDLNDSKFGIDHEILQKALALVKNEKKTNIINSKTKKQTSNQEQNFDFDEYEDIYD